MEISEANNIKSIRAGKFVGKHEVIFGLASQTLELFMKVSIAHLSDKGNLHNGLQIPTGFYTMEEIIIELFRTSVPANVNK